MTRSSVQPLVCGLLALSIAACGGESSGPRTPAALAAATPSTAVTGSVGTAVNPVPAVTVKDASGAAIGSVLVNWRVVSGGGTIQHDTSRSNASGVASVGRWTLGTAAGAQEIEAMVSGAGTVRFSAQAAPGALNRLTRVSAETQAGVVGLPVATLPAVRAEDMHGNPIANATISFTVVSGGGTVAGASKQTNAAGIATVDGWTLGGTRGQQLLRASSSSVIATFAANAVAGAPASMEIVTGNNQEGVNGIAVPTAPMVRVLDSFGNPVGGESVVFTPGENSGTVGVSTAVTNASTGTASASTWILGESPSPTLHASLQSAPGISANFVAIPTISLLRITVRWIGAAPPPRVQLAVQRAVDKWRGALIDRSGVSNVNTAAGFCRTWAPAVSEVVDGLLLVARVGEIDGPFNVLANANICALHAETGLPAYGSILVDEQDVAAMSTNGAIDPVLVHEMGHSLGFHSGFFGPPRFPGHVQYQSSTNPQFHGPKAVTSFLALGGGSISPNSIPLQSTGANTFGGHWREEALTTELMTSSISLQNPLAPLSRITIGLMEDIGYTVRYTSADNFGFFAPLVTGHAQPIELGEDVVGVSNGAVQVAPMVRRVKR